VRGLTRGRLDGAVLYWGVQARPTSLALGETPELLFADAREVGSLIVHNPSADTVAWLKIWAGRTAVPGSDAAHLAFPIAPGTLPTVIPLFAQVNGASYIAATLNATLTDATAPDEDLIVNVTSERVRC
jgi:hypothetical protein